MTSGNSECALHGRTLDPAAAQALGLSSLAEGLADGELESLIDLKATRENVVQLLESMRAAATTL